jgi:hypothetical protein
MTTNVGAVRTRRVAQGPSWLGFAVLLGLVLVTAGIVAQVSERREPTGAGTAAVIEAVPISVAAIEHRGDFRGGAVKVAPPFEPTHGLTAFHPGDVKVGPDTVDTYRTTRLVPDGRRTGMK